MKFKIDTFDEYEYGIDLDLDKIVAELIKQSSEQGEGTISTKYGSVSKKRKSVKKGKKYKPVASGKISFKNITVGKVLVNVKRITGEGKKQQLTVSVRKLTKTEIHGAYVANVVEKLREWYPDAPEEEMNKVIAKLFTLTSQDIYHVLYNVGRYERNYDSTQYVEQVGALDEWQDVYNSFMAANRGIHQPYVKQKRQRIVF